MTRRMDASILKHAKLGCCNAVARGPFHFEMSSGIQTAERLEHGFARSPGIEQRADGHVAADTRECIQVTDAVMDSVHSSLYEAAACANAGNGALTPQKAAV